MKNTFTLAIVAAGLSFASSALAADAVLSPKAASQKDSVRIESGTTQDMIDRSVKAASPKALALAHDVRVESGTTTDMLARNIVPVSPKVLANEPWRSGQFQIAPLK